ncbi:hypothetical protein LCGC14_2030800, partial [marine sediment metagenome]
MNFNSLDKFNEKKKNIVFIFVILAIILAFIMAGLLQGLISLTLWAGKLLIKHWAKILIGLVVLLFLKRIL